MDVAGIEPGLDFVEVLNRRLEDCEARLCVIGPNWLNARDHAGERRLNDENDFVRLEVQTALERSIRVIPILVEGALAPRTDDLPAELQPLARRQTVAISHERFRADVDYLNNALAKFIETTDKPTLTPFQTQPNPTQIATDYVGSLLSLFGKYRDKDSMFVAPDITEKRLKNARKKCDIPFTANILMLVDFTVFGNANDSMVFTDEGIFYHHSLNTDGDTKSYTPYPELVGSVIGEKGVSKITAASKTFKIDGGIKKVVIIEILEEIRKIQI
jgi:hypothetical protein